MGNTPPSKDRHGSSSGAGSRSSTPNSSRRGRRSRRESSVSNPAASLKSVHVHASEQLSDMDRVKLALIADGSIPSMHSSASATCTSGGTGPSSGSQRRRSSTTRGATCSGTLNSSTNSQSCRRGGGQRRRLSTQNFANSVSIMDPQDVLRQLEDFAGRTDMQEDPSEYLTSLRNLDYSHTGS
ncbi:expressed unknown protein [Seminavis robusta]|uniref:Uncharacterized protein n=1 Tax=Seminavis robusta TaxID=568900 RepID=A0A9N8DLP8_9STRA|nr:expressed unknown protein [Seminavis robusta]|eukprot:Sro226_g091951.1  (183) ;mRNA; f:13529-14077